MTRPRQVLWIPALVAALAWVHAPDVFATDATDRTALQATIENGEDLGSRAQAVLYRARSRQDAGDPAAAAQLIETWLAGDANRDHALLRFNLGVSRLELGEPAAALPEFRRAVELEPEFARAWLRRGEAAHQADRLDEARTSFAAAYEALPNPPLDLLYYMAAIGLQLELPAEALQDMERLFTQAPDSLHLDWYRTVVAAALAAGRPERAQSHLDRLLRLAPSDPAAWDLAYRFAAGREDYQGAAVCLTIKGHLQPLTATEHRQLGDLYFAIEIPRQAAAHYELAAEQDGAEPVDHERLAGAWLAAHDPVRARQALQSGLAEAPTAELWSRLGDLEFQNDNHAAALAAFRRSCDLDPTRGRAWLMRGWSASELDRRDEAREFLRRAVTFPEQRRSAEALLANLNRRSVAP